MVVVPGLNDGAAAACERSFPGCEKRDAHVDRDLAVVLHSRLDDAALRLDPDDALRSQTAVADKLHKAACAVAALLDLAAVSVENPVAKVDVVAARFFHDQYLIAAHAEMTVGQALQLWRAQVDPLRDAVKDDKIVAQTLHLGEFQAHVRGHRLYAGAGAAGSGMSPRRANGR